VGARAKLNLVSQCAAQELFYQSRFGVGCRILRALTALQRTRTIIATDGSECRERRLIDFDPTGVG
jgi:hypothetical protein